MKLKKILVLATCITILGAIEFAMEGFDANSVALAHAPTDFRASVSWTQETWRDSDAPFSDIDTAIQFQLQKLGDASLLGAYRNAALKDISNAKVVYGWASVARLVARKARTPQERRESQRLITDVYDTMLRPAEPDLYRMEPYFRHIRPLPDSPHSYRYTRLLYLISVGNGIPDVANKKQFLALCDRLLQRDPTDLTVKLARLIMLEHLRPVFKDENPQLAPQSDTLIKQSRLQALQMAKQLRLEYPKSLPVLARLADIYYWLWDGNNEYDNLSIATYNEYLNLAPPDDESRSDARATIADIQELQKSFAQRKR